MTPLPLRLHVVAGFIAASLLVGCGASRPATETAAVRETAAAAEPGRLAATAAALRPVAGGADDYADLLAAAAGARRILLGESTHGTHEYYRERARITERLVREHGVNAVAIEGDWSATQRANLYVRGLGSDRNAEQALRGYTNFPWWMWPNTDFRDFVDRLRALNLGRSAAERVGLYGMDVYDLYDAADAVLAYLRSEAPESAARAREAYRCFARHGRSTHAYGEAARKPEGSCERQARAVLADVRRLPEPRDPAAAEARFAAVRSAASVAAAEEYFRTAYAGSLAWNVRDRRMAENVEEIAAHVEALTGRPGKVAIWSHNTHSGDARATFAAERGELNLGQLMRERHGGRAFLIGFLSHEGEVYAAPEWDSPGRVYRMRPAVSGSYAALFGTLGTPAFSLLIRGRPELERELAGPLLERAIGVVYRPESERTSHYFRAELSRQFDAVVFFARTSAVTPLRHVRPENRPATLR